jgi:hypothetical protein
MESSRDSSVWQSLAVTFGGGLALGAVAMKLTQNAHRPVDVTPQPEPDAVAGRLKIMERRLERMEHTPVPPRPLAAVPAPAAAIDQKVLEAVIGAVDARLHEHAGQIDRRLADLEARMAVAHGLQQQDHEAVALFEQEAAELRSAVAQELRQVREGVSRATAGQTATRSDFEMLRQEYRQEAAKLREEMEQSVETRIVTSAAAAAAAQLEEQLAPLRAEVRQKEQELAGLRQRLAESEKSVLDVVLAIGEVCRQAADRMGNPRDVKPAAPPPAPLAPKAETSATLEAPVPIATPPAPKVETMTAPPAAEASPFLQDANPRMSWRVPLVSTLLVSTGYLALMHYLSASLQ